MATVRQVYTNIRGIQTAIKDVGRLREILRVFARHGFGALVTRLGLTEIIGVRGLMEYKDENEIPISLAGRIRLAVEELGPTFVKLGQILSTRSDIVPPDILEELEQLQDQVPPMPWSDVKEQVERELGSPVGELFTSFEERALASASIAQAHRAVLPDGTPVVVKVQRPGIRAKIDSDLNILLFLARRAEALVPELSLMGPVAMVGEFEKALRKEMDFSTERGHILRFRKNFEGFEGVRLPRVFDDRSTSGVLTMDFIGGVKCTQAPREYGIDPHDLAPRMLAILLKMIFKDGFFHGDLHPGNILIDREGTIGLIDFGLAGRLTPTQRDSLLDILVGLTREDYSLIARTFFEVGIKLPGVSYDLVAFEADTIEIMEEHFAGRTLDEVDVGAFFADLVKGAIKHQIRMPPVYTMVFKAIMTVEGIGKRLTPDLNLIEEATPFVADVLLDRYNPRRLLREGIRTLTGLSRFLGHFPTVANQLLRDAEQGRLVVRAEMQNLPVLVEEQRRSTTTIVRAVLVGAFVVAGTLALETPIVPLGGVSALSILFYVCALVFARPFLGLAIRGR